MASMSANMIDASCAADAHGARGMLALPLNLISLIVSHLDDVADLARLCRTCRVLNYMALPQLYRELTLTSYDKIRYRDDFPEGCGSASPFSMGLNAVVTRRNVARLVRSFALRGEWREDGLEEHARVGRVPDSSMMLNITVRVAIERMIDLEEFSWELNTKLLETVYTGLASLPKLRSLTVRFPSSRLPRPTIVIPPMPHLRALKVTHIDPLCYPDDLSNLFVHSRKLRELKLHWSSRMKEEQEPSVTLNHYFRKCIAMKAPVRLRKLSMMNFYALHTDDFENAFDPEYIEDVTILSSPGVSELGAVSFVEASWPKSKTHGSIKSMRMDRLDKRGCEFLSEMTALEKLYFVHPVITVADLVNSARPTSMVSRSAAVTPASGEIPANVLPASAQSVAPQSFTSQALLADSYIQMISSVHAERLRHLLLPSRWALPSSAIGRLIRGCPNLEQLGLATEISAYETVALLLPFLRKLRALRLLIPTPLPTSNPASNHGTPVTNPTYIPPAQNPYGHPHGSLPAYADPSCQGVNTARAITEIVSLDDAIHTRALSLRLSDKELYGNLKILGLGWKAWELGDFYTVPAEDMRPRENAPDVNLEETRPARPMTRSGSLGTNPVLMNGDARWTCPPNAPSPSQTGVSVLGKRKDRCHDEPDHPHSYRAPPISQPQLSMPHPQHLPVPVPTTPNNPSTPFQPLHHTPQPHHPNPPQQPSQHEDLPNQPLSHPNATANATHNPVFPHDLSALRTETGEPVSEQTKFEIQRCFEKAPHVEVHAQGTGTEANGGGDTSASTGVPDGMVLRRRVKRADWSVLKEWEIWGLDAQEI